MIARLVFAGFLLAHALIHVGFVTPAPAATADGPAWPFDPSRSWILNALGVGPGTDRLIAMALVAATIAGFALAGVAALGMGPAELWRAGVVAGSLASVALLVVFFHPWLVLGIAIDAILVLAALAGGWTPARLDA